MGRDPYRDMSYSDRCDAYREGRYEECRQYDRDSESSDRAYENYLNGGDFADPHPDERFS